MKPILSSLILLAAGPALAHTGAHMHPHASDPVWVPLLMLGLGAAGAGLVLAVRRK